MHWKSILSKVFGLFVLNAKICINLFKTKSLVPARDEKNVPTCQQCWCKKNPILGKIFTLFGQESE